MLNLCLLIKHLKSAINCLTLSGLCSFSHCHWRGAFIISTKLIPTRQTETGAGKPGTVQVMRFSDESAFATLQTLEGCRVVQYVHMHWGHTQCPHNATKRCRCLRPYPLSHTFLPQPLTCTLTATWSVRVTFGVSDSLWPLCVPTPPAPTPPAPTPPASSLTIFPVHRFPPFPPKSTRLAYLNNARQVATALLGLYFVWLRCASASAATHQDTFGHILPLADWLWLTIRRFYIEFMLCLALPWLDSARGSY